MLPCIVLHVYSFFALILLRVLTLILENPVDNPLGKTKIKLFNQNLVAKIISSKVANNLGTMIIKRFRELRQIGNPLTRP